MRLQIAMNDPLLMRRRKPLAKLQSQAGNFRQSQRPSLNLLAKRDARNQLQSQKIHSILARELVNSLNIRMIQLGERQSFLAKSLPSSLVSQHPGRQHFKRNITVQLFVMSAINLAHAASSNLLNDQVVPQRIANHEKNPTSARMLVPTQTQVNATPSAPTSVPVGEGASALPPFGPLAFYNIRLTVGVAVLSVRSGLPRTAGVPA